MTSIQLKTNLNDHHSYEDFKPSDYTNFSIALQPVLKNMKLYHSDNWQKLDAITDKTEYEIVDSTKNGLIFITIIVLSLLFGIMFSKSQSRH